VLSLALSSACGLVPIDNSGGEPPPGDELSFRFIAQTGNIGGVDDATLVTAANVSDTDACRSSFGEDAELPFCGDALAELQDDERLVVVRMQLGGCLGPGLGVDGAYIEGETIHMHVIKSDYAYGRVDTACTDDLGASAHAIAVKGAEGATEAAVTVGVYNPELPGGPAERTYETQ